MCISIFSCRDGELLRQDVASLYYIWRWSGRGDVVMAVDIPETCDEDGNITGGVEYEIVIRKKMK